MRLKLLLVKQQYSLTLAKIESCLAGFFGFNNVHVFVFRHDSKVVLLCFDLLWSQSGFV
jgi:hypothetical protein